jgi:hypothetical protein
MKLTEAHVRKLIASELRRPDVLEAVFGEGALGEPSFDLSRYPGYANFYDNIHYKSDGTVMRHDVDLSGDGDFDSPEERAAIMGELDEEELAEALGVSLDELKAIIKEEKRRIILESPRGIDDETKAIMVMEAIQQNLNDPYFVDGLWEYLGLEVPWQESDEVDVPNL